jgi:hypothetical protein
MKNKAKGLGNMAPVVQYLPSNHDVTRGGLEDPGLGFCASWTNNYKDTDCKAVVKFY